MSFNRFLSLARENYRQNCLCPPPPYLLWLREWPISILLSCLCSRLSSPSHSLSPLCFSVYRENKGGADNEHLRTDTSHTISDTASLIFPPPQTQHIFPRLKGSWQVILLMVSLGWQLGKKKAQNCASCVREKSPAFKQNNDIKLYLRWVLQIIFNYIFIQFKPFFCGSELYLYS